MKRNLTFALIAGMLSLISCSKEKKEDELTSDLNREWIVVKYEVNGFDETDAFNSLYPDYSIDFNSDNSYTEYYLVYGITVPVNGTWEFQNDLDDIQLVDPNQSRLYHIVELSSSKLTVEDANTSDDDVYYLQPK